MSPSLPPAGKRLLDRLGGSIYDHLIEPFLQTHDPLPRVAWGAAIGVFVGLTPTVGIQMYLVTIVWVICRYGFRARFNLTIAISMVWMSNPVTMLPLYFLFLKTGDGVLSLLGYDVTVMTFALFREEVGRLGEGQSLDWLQWLLYAGQVFLLEFGWPVVIGSLIYAVPGSILAYPFTFVTLRRYRRYLARSQGITYEEWRQRSEARP